MFSYTVNSSNTATSWNTTPIFCFFMSYASGFISFPNIFILPLLKFNNDNIQFIVVDFPLPFGPNKPSISPSYTSNDKSSTAFNSFILLN